MPPFPEGEHTGVGAGLRPTGRVRLNTHGGFVVRLTDVFDRFQRGASETAVRLGGKPATRQRDAHVSPQVVRDTLVATALGGGVGERLASLRPLDLVAVLSAGTKQGLGTSLVAGLHGAGMPVPDWLEAHRFDTTLRRAQIVSALGAIAPMFGGSGLPWAVLKGPVISPEGDGSSDREYGDLDLLVTGAGLRESLELLDDIGTEALNRNWEPYIEHRVAEFPVHALGVPIDLHWHLIGLGRVRDRFSISTAEVLERRIGMPVGGVEIQRLDVEDNLIHVALHAGLAGATRMSALRDVHWLVDGQETDWDTVLVRTRRFGCGSIVGQVLDRCRTVLGTPVPGGFAERLAPIPALRVRRYLDGVSMPMQRLYEHSYPGFPVSVARDGTIETTGRACELLRTRLETRMGSAPRWSAYDPEGPLFWQRDTGGATGLPQYLEFAAASS